MSVLNNTLTKIACVVAPTSTHACRSNSIASQTRGAIGGGSAGHCTTLNVGTIQRLQSNMIHGPCDVKLAMSDCSHPPGPFHPGHCNALQCPPPGPFHRVATILGPPCHGPVPGVLNCCFVGNANGLSSHNPRGSLAMTQPQLAPGSCPGFPLPIPPCQYKQRLSPPMRL